MYDTTNAYDSLYYMQLESGKFVAKATIVSAKAAVKFTKKSDGFFGYHEHNFANDRNSGHVVG